MSTIDQPQLPTWWLVMATRYNRLERETQIAKATLLAEMASTYAASDLK